MLRGGGGAGLPLSTAVFFGLTSGREGFRGFLGFTGLGV